MLEIQNRKTLQSKIKVCKSDVKIGDCAHSLGVVLIVRLGPTVTVTGSVRSVKIDEY